MREGRLWGNLGFFGWKCGILMWWGWCWNGCGLWCIGGKWLFGNLLGWWGKGGLFWGLIGLCEGCCFCFWGLLGWWGGNWLILCDLVWWWLFLFLGGNWLEFCGILEGGNWLFFDWNCFFFWGLFMFEVGFGGFLRVFIVGGLVGLNWCSEGLFIFGGGIFVISGGGVFGGIMLGGRWVLGNGCCINIGGGIKGGWFGNMWGFGGWMWGGVCLIVFIVWGCFVFFLLVVVWVVVSFMSFFWFIFLRFLLFLIVFVFVLLVFDFVEKDYNKEMKEVI